MNEHVSDETVRLLETLLGRAYEGRLLGVAFIGIERGRRHVTGWSGEVGHDPTFALGALQHLNDNLLTHAKRYRR